MKKFKPVRESGNKFSSYIRALKGKSGVYIIRKARGSKYIYIGQSSSNLYKTITRHFQSWDDPRQVRTSYLDSGGQYLFKSVLLSPARALKLEKALIIKHRPLDNPNKLDFYELNDLTSKEKSLLSEFEDLPF